jgi:sugar O-acyltransferase (sialic acid O-acetyltransferase NeuD family)
LKKLLKEVVVKKDSIAIVGFHEGSAGQIYEWIKNEHHVSCFINYNEERISELRRESTLYEYPKNSLYKGIPLIKSRKYFEILRTLKINKILITISDKEERFKAIELAREYNMELISVIHPSVLVLDDALIEDSVIIHAGVIIGYKAEIKSGVIVNSGCIIEHHCVIKECVTIDPNVTLAGNVVVESFSHLHTSATVINKVKISNNAIIGAGAVVITDIEPYTTNIGVHSKILKRHQLKGFRYD